MTLSLEILTPKEVLASENSVKSIHIPAHWGTMEILPQYADYVTSLTEGTLTYTVEGKQPVTHNISGGMIAIKDGKATILADSLMATVTDINSKRS